MRGKHSDGSPQITPPYYYYDDVLLFFRTGDGRATGVDK